MFLPFSVGPVSPRPGMSGLAETRPTAAKLVSAPPVLFVLYFPSSSSSMSSLKKAHEDKEDIEDMIANRGHRRLCAKIKFS